MMVTFPIAFLLAVVPSDAAWLLTGDSFWPRMSWWLLGGGVLMGLLASIAGTIELLTTPGVRRRPAGWNHFLSAVVLLAVAFTNWYLRLQDPEALLIPWGLTLSLVGALLVVIAGWLGGDLVFEHQLGVSQEDDV